MRSVVCTLVLLASISTATAAEGLPQPFITGLKNPESVAVALGNRVFVTEIGEFDKDGDGTVLEIKGEKAVPFADGLDDPKGVAGYGDWLFVADKKRIWRVNRMGKAEVFVAAEAFPAPPQFLNDVVIDPESGTLYVTDSGDLKGQGGAVYRITPKAQVSLVVDNKKLPELHTPNGLAMDGASSLLLLDFGTGQLYRIRLADRLVTKVADGFGGGDGLAWDKFGRLFLTDWKNGKVFAIARPGDKPVLLAEGFQWPADLCLDPGGKTILVPDMKAGTLTRLPTVITGAEVDETPLPLGAAPAFPELKWTDWKAETASGKVNPLRPILLTHAGDGSNRIFCPTQHGVIHVFPNDPKTKQTQVFLDLQDRVYYSDETNEEGFLGLAFHPNYKQNGEFFVFYTLKKPKLTNVLCRFRVRPDNPDQADPDSEEELLRIQRPFWNHDGGTICFGPDGYLYVALGDGGAANDPFDNGQNLKTLLGKVLRIDVNRKDTGKAYGIPKDNPFVGRDGAASEIWAYGLRNVWRMAFDRKTGQLWAGDVGQNLYEEIDILKAGGNYGWNRREGLHPFGAKGMNPQPDLIDPIWEYHHDVGKSITGGLVYRGQEFPELEGAYIYGDYVSNRVWALRYDESKKRVVANRPIRDAGKPILSFGEDEKGEIYYMTFTPTGQGIYRLARSAAGKR